MELYIDIEPIVGLAVLSGGISIISAKSTKGGTAGIAGRLEGISRISIGTGFEISGRGARGVSNDSLPFEYLPAQVGSGPDLSSRRDGLNDWRIDCMTLPEPERMWDIGMARKGGTRAICLEDLDGIRDGAENRDVVGGDGTGCIRSAQCSFDW